MTTLRSVPGRLVDEFMFQGYADTEGRVVGPFAALERGFIPDPAPRFWIRFIEVEIGWESTYRGCAPWPSPGPYAERGEAEDVATWLNRRAEERVFYYATTRSPIEP